jgi:hypothetical protein
MVDRERKSWLPGARRDGSACRVAPNLRAILAPHVPLQFVDGRCLRPPHDVQRHGLVCIAAEASDFKVAMAGVQGVTEGRGRLRRTFVSEHTLIPSNTGEFVGFLARFLGTLRRMPDRRAINALAGFRAHRARMRQRGFDRQAATAWAFSPRAHKARAPRVIRCPCVLKNQAASAVGPTLDVVWAVIQD